MLKNSDTIVLRVYQECPLRPIVFIGHCFGGIVIEKVDLPVQ